MERSRETRKVSLPFLLLHQHCSDAQAVLALTSPMVPMFRCRFGAFTAGDDLTMFESRFRVGIGDETAASGADGLLVHRLPPG